MRLEGQKVVRPRKILELWRADFGKIPPESEFGVLRRSFPLILSFIGAPTELRYGGSRRLGGGAVKVVAARVSVGRRSLKEEDKMRYLY
ncbi:hypothetical protein COLO4_30173 [Corchorus olitorius]|uniref:Uncharacterized protein n=1 Tax=Corchorus olitorius TaxID=93759 RepID=A0A1R3HAW1_9ROSI|nr:hypothetical protein COLO4_30173 [Corchorus olitorius]